MANYSNISRNILDNAQSLINYVTDGPIDYVDFIFEYE